MVIHASGIAEVNGRRPYDLGGREILSKHFVTRVTTPETPFIPHKHEVRELWFILDGKAVVSLDGIDHEVEARDLIAIDPWVEHGLSTSSRAVWICMG